MEASMINVSSPDTGYIADRGKGDHHLQTTVTITALPSSPETVSSSGLRVAPKRVAVSAGKDQQQKKTTETVVYKLRQNSHKNSDLSSGSGEKNLQFTIIRNKNSVVNNSAMESNRSHFQRHFGNIFDDEEMVKLSINQEEDLNTEYFCIFCDSTFKDKEEARRHYQKHVNYYPMMCSLCGEGLTDMQEFLKHHTEEHPDANKGRYKRREQPIVDKWINGFLYAQATVIRAFPAREQCPVCERVFTEEQIKAARPRRCTVNRKIDHVHRHLCYLPYECIRCKEEGKEFVVAYFESKAHSHIKLKHPEIDDTESRWFVFQKTISIPKLDEYIAGFFTQYGISMEYERRPVKKQCRETFSSPDFLSVYNNSTISNSVINQADKLNSGTMIIISQSSQIEKKDTSSARNNDGVIILDDIEDDNTASGSSSFQISNSDNPDAMIVEVSPSHADYLKMGEDSRNPIEYFCIFCSVKLASKLEAYPHYGEHLGYKPVACLLCENRFHDIEEFTTHHQFCHPETIDLMYEIREDQNVEKWVDEFLDSQQNSSTQQLTLSCSCAACCPVCDRLRGNLPLTQCVSHSDVDFSDHIHQHLIYFTYECSLCKKFGRTTRVPNLDSIAMSHMKEQHMIPETNVYQLSRTFPKTLTIPKLDKFIAESVQKKRNLEKKWKTKPDSSSIVITSQGSNGVSDASSNSGSSKTAQSQSNLLKGVAHVRVEGGRVVNLPSSISIRAIQQKHQKQTIDLNKHSLKGDTLKGEGITAVPALRFYVKCLHCNIELPSRKQLKIHHRQEHPGLSMACFTTPKSMLSLGSS
ncbi:hypothetical protein B4U79_15285 [Dinothrombium tinctorium]|uniref:C2H2-type domain-containing protein n=1 Tax=Dinothrombium tinctorium TaxID=1965070 RepID=A0A3S3P5S0_9ACAR|nr:hypothetical protein B4U79_00302 [Dinothrombium tinctorium]RWS15495.1 hypothetical protein B4U79_01887 [Dinothrombium tinctorium]RWS15513.1 hypothetical protein B4U79_15285 [Dinothrombium tinctorium]